MLRKEHSELKDSLFKLGELVHPVQPALWEPKAEGSQIQAQPGPLNNLERPCIKIKNKRG